RARSWTGNPVDRSGSTASRLERRDCVIRTVHQRLHPTAKGPSERAIEAGHRQCVGFLLAEANTLARQPHGVGDLFFGRQIGKLHADHSETGTSRPPRVARSSGNPALRKPSPTRGHTWASASGVSAKAGMICSAKVRKWATEAPGAANSTCSTPPASS